MRRGARVAPWCVALGATLLVACGGTAPPPTVLAAASLAGVFEDLDPSLRCSYSASSTAARQVDAGAPADLLVVADPRWLPLAGARAGPGVVIATNRLVLVAPIDSTLAIDPASPPPAVDRLALGDPSHVPVGRYAEQALRALDWWKALEPRVVPATDARAALRLVALGEAGLGVVYASDAAAETRVRVVAELPQRLHDPIRYVAAVIDHSAEGQRLLDLLRAPPGRAALARAGLVPMVVGDAGP